MTCNFWFLSGGRNAASTIQAIQRATGPPDARPRAPLPLADRVEGYTDAIPQPVIVPPTSQNLAPRRAPAPRLQNLEIMSQRSARSSKKDRSRSPQSISSRITGVQDLPHPPQDLPPGQWIPPPPISQGVWQTPVQDKVQVAPPGFSVPGPPGQSPSGPQRPYSAFPFQPTPGTSTVIVWWRPKVYNTTSSHSWPSQLCFGVTTNHGNCDSKSNGIQSLVSTTCGQSVFHERQYDQLLVQIA